MKILKKKRIDDNFKYKIGDSIKFEFNGKFYPIVGYKKGYYDIDYYTIEVDFGHAHNAPGTVNEYGETITFDKPFYLWVRIIDYN